MQLKWGILSASKISGDFVLSMNSLDPNHHKVVAVAATDLERAKEFASKVGYGIHNMDVHKYLKFESFFRNKIAETNPVTIRNAVQYS